jgi:hypothetical protein
VAFIHPGAARLALVSVVELGLITCVGVFNPVFATSGLNQTETDRVARTPVRVVGHQQGHHRGHDRPVGAAGRHHQRPHCNRDRRSPHADNPAPAPPT